MFESMNIGDTKIVGLKLLMGHERPDLRDASAVDVEVTSEIELVLDVGNTTIGWHAATGAVVPHGRRKRPKEVRLGQGKLMPHGGVSFCWCRPGRSHQLAGAWPQRSELCGSRRRVLH